SVRCPRRSPTPPQPSSPTPPISSEVRDRGGRQQPTSNCSGHTDARTGNVNELHLAVLAGITGTKIRGEASRDRGDDDDAHTSRSTSTILPPEVNGFFNDDDTVSNCTAVKNAASPR